MLPVTTLLPACAEICPPVPVVRVVLEGCVAGAKNQCAVRCDSVHTCCGPGSLLASVPTHYRLHRGHRRSAQRMGWSRVARATSACRPHRRGVGHCEPGTARAPAALAGHCGHREGGTSCEECSAPAPFAASGSCCTCLSMHAPSSQGPPAVRLDGTCMQMVHACRCGRGRVGGGGEGRSHPPSLRWALTSGTERLARTR